MNARINYEHVFIHTSYNQARLTTWPFILAQRLEVVFEKLNYNKNLIKIYLEKF